MPRLGTPQAGGVFTCLSPGTSVDLINEAIPGDGSVYFSNPVSLALAPSGDIMGFSVWFEWAITPVGSGAIQLYGSNTRNSAANIASGDFVSLVAIGAALAKLGAFPPVANASALLKFRYVTVGFTGPSVANNLIVTIQG